MPTLGLLARSHEGDGGGDSPRRLSRVPAQCDEPGMSLYIDVY